MDTDEPIAAVYTLNVTLRGEDVEAPTVVDLERAVEVAVADLVEGATVNAIGKRTDR